VSHSRDTGADNPVDAVCHLDAPFELDGVAGGFRHKPARVADSSLDARLVAHIGHIADHEDSGCATADGRGMADHIIHGSRQRGLITEHRHRQAVADQDHIQTRFFLQVSRGVIVTSQPSDGFIILDFIEQIR